ncbi:MAG: bifunctional hydroxymethylpyrimidine kinase/phosphomethylpyrimidine kinase, partial [Mycobacteriales bacterium]
STTGTPLLDPEGLRALREGLLGLATVVTPNLAEVELLTGRSGATDRDLLPAAHALLELGPAWVLVTGGHLPGEPVDLLTDGEQVVLLREPRSANPHTHGTGCTLATALAVGLARGLDVPAAAAAAKAFVTGAIQAGYPLGQGRGPVDQGWRLR